MDVGFGGGLAGEGVRAAVQEVVFEALGRFGLDGEEVPLAAFDLAADVQEHLVAVGDGLVVRVDVRGFVLDLLALVVGRGA